MTRRERQALTRERLLEVASAEFIDRGCGATSLERIAERAGFSKGAVYSNFAGKQELVQGCGVRTVVGGHGHRAVVGLAPFDLATILVSLGTGLSFSRMLEPDVGPGVLAALARVLLTGR